MIYTLIILAVLTVLLCIAVCNVSGRESDRELIEWCRQMEDDDEVIFEIDERGEDESENNRCGEHRKGDDYGNAERVQTCKAEPHDRVGAAGVG